MQAQLPEWTVFVGLTATLEPDEQTNMIISSIGFKANFNFEKHNCECHNVDLIIHEIKYPCTAHKFRDLDWLIPPDLTKASDLLKQLVYTFAGMDVNLFVTCIRLSGLNAKLKALHHFIFPGRP